MLGTPVAGAGTQLGLAGSGLATAGTTAGGTAAGLGSTGLGAAVGGAAAAGAGGGGFWSQALPYLAGSALQSYAGLKNAQTQAAAAQNAIDLQREMFNKQLELQAPWQQAGVNALAKMGTGFTGQVDLTQDPGYAFRMSEGMKALERSAAARGGLLSGSMLKGAQR